MNNPTMPQPTPPFSRRRGFTLIELLVVVGIIAILSSLLVIGISKLRTNSKRQQTAQILQNCSAVFAEYDAIARQHYDSFDLNPGTGAIGAPGNVSTGGSDRYSAHVFLTEAVFSLMRAQPNIRASLDKFSAAK